MLYGEKDKLHCSASLRSLSRILNTMGFSSGDFSGSELLISSKTRAQTALEGNNSEDGCSAFEDELNFGDDVANVVVNDIDCDDDFECLVDECLDDQLT